MSNDEGDPFEELSEDAEDREGDPFEYLEDASDDRESAGDTTAEPNVGDDETPPESEPSSERRQTGSPDDEDQTVDFGLGRPDETPEEEQTDAPESTDDDQPADEKNVAKPADESGAGMDFGGAVDTSTGPEVATDAFADVDQREGDPFEGTRSVFEEMDVESIDPDEVWEGLEGAEGRGSVVEKSDRTYAEVSKHSYCEQCEYFSEPPDVTCSHDGTEIVEFLDMDTVRLVDCPVVAERKELEAED